MEKHYTVYCLYSTVKPEKTYVGITCNLKRRLRQHNGKGGARCTRAHRPWAVFLCVSGPLSYAQASQLEYAWKHKRRGGKGRRGRVQTLQYLWSLVHGLTQKADPLPKTALTLYSNLSQDSIHQLCHPKWPLLDVSTLPLDMA